MVEPGVDCSASRNLSTPHLLHIMWYISISPSYLLCCAVATTAVSTPLRSLLGIAVLYHSILWVISAHGSCCAGAHKRIRSPCVSKRYDGILPLHDGLLNYTS